MVPVDFLNESFPKKSSYQARMEPWSGYLAYVFIQDKLTRMNHLCYCRSCVQPFLRHFHNPIKINPLGQ